MFSITVYNCIYYDTYIHSILLEVNPVQNIHAALNIRNAGFMNYDNSVVTDTIIKPVPSYCDKYLLSILVIGTVYFSFKQL